MSEPLKVPLTPTGRALLVLIKVTGDWLIPEHGKMWRGADGTRLNIQGRPHTGIDVVRVLERRGLIARFHPPATFLHPIWMSTSRGCYRLTETGEGQAALVPMEEKS